MAVLLRCAVCVCEADQVMALVAICERVSFGASKVTEDSFAGIPVSLAGVFKELRKGRNGKGDVRASGDCSVHEATNSLTVRDFLHMCGLGVI